MGQQDGIGQTVRDVEQAAQTVRDTVGDAQTAVVEGHARHARSHQHGITRPHVIHMAIRTVQIGEHVADGLLSEYGGERVAVT